MLSIYHKLGYWAVLDVIIIAFIVYRLLLLIRGTRAMQMALGILMMIGITFAISQVYPLTTLKWLMDKFYSSLIIIIFILFQEDIRRVFSRLGKRTVFSNQEQTASRQGIDEICRAATGLAAKKIGALMVIERNIILSRYIDIGILIDSKISNELLLSIFHPTSPIHDGAVVIQQGRVAAAGCFLPLTRDENVDSYFGTRHRAALGISQETDAVALVISEETSSISLMVDGKILRNIDAKELRKALRTLLIAETGLHQERLRAGRVRFLEAMRRRLRRGL